MPQVSEPELTQSEVLAALKRGESIVGRRIGALRWRGATLCCGLALIDCDIAALDLRDARIEGGVELDGSKLRERAAFGGAVFEQQATFRRVSFGGGADFSGVRFVGRTHFNMARFDRWSSFKQARFEARTLFSKAHFPRGVDFEKASFESATRDDDPGHSFSFNDMLCAHRFQMRGCRFADPVTFTGTRFADIVELDGCRFGDDVKLKYVQFARNATFRGAVFEGELHLNGSSAEGDVLFEETRFESILNLQSVSGQRNVDLATATLGPRGRLQLDNAHFSRLLIDRSHVEGHLDSYERGDFATARKEFGLLKSSFGDINEYEQEDWAYLMERRMERFQMPWGWGEPLGSLKRVFNWLALDLGCGYGTRPLNILFSSLILLAGFAGLYFLGDALSAEPVFEARYCYQNGPFKGVIRASSALLLSFRVFTNAEVNSADPDADSLLNQVMVVESFLGIFVMMVLVVTYSRKVIR